MNPLQIISVLLIAPGLLVVAGAKWAVTKYGLDKNAKADFEHEMTEDELRIYKYNRTVLNVKMFGMLVAVPGLILTFIAFR